MPAHNANNATAAALAAAADCDHDRLMAVAASCAKHPPLLAGVMMRMAQLVRVFGHGMIQADAIEALREGARSIQGPSTPDGYPFAGIAGFVAGSLSLSARELYQDAAVGRLVSCVAEAPASHSWALLASASRGLVAIERASGEDDRLADVLAQLGHDDSWRAEDESTAEMLELAARLELAGIDPGELARRQQAAEADAEADDQDAGHDHSGEPSDG